MKDIYRGSKEKTRGKDTSCNICDRATLASLEQSMTWGHVRQRRIALFFDQKSDHCETTSSLGRPSS
jgi:hypothetical protein